MIAPQHNSKRHCPVCWRHVSPTTRGNIQGHWDSTGNDLCPMSGEAYDLANIGRRQPRSLVGAA